MADLILPAESSTPAPTLDSLVAMLVAKDAAFTISRSVTGDFRANIVHTMRPRELASASGSSAIAALSAALDLFKTSTPELFA